MKCENETCELETTNGGLCELCDVNLEIEAAWILENYNELGELYDKYHDIYFSNISSTGNKTR